MSFLFLRGKMYHCIKCGTSLVVEYKGGAYDTQIGDASVFEQWFLHKKYMNESYNPEKDGYYYHVELFCEDCLKSSNHMNEEVILIEKDEIYHPYSLLDLNERFIKTIEPIIADVAQRYVNLFTKELCKSINQHVYDITVGSESFSIPDKKPELVDLYVYKAKLYIIQNFYEFLSQDGEYNKKIETYKRRAAPHEAYAKKLIDEGKKQYFYSVDLNASENLNPIICYDLTLRSPEKVVSKCKFYSGPHNIPTFKIRETLQQLPIKRLVKTGTPTFVEMYEGLKQKMCSF